MTPGREPAASGQAHATPFLDLAALSGFAVAQPVFGALAGSTDYLVFVDAGRLQLVVLALLVAVAPPVLLWGAERACAALFPRAAPGLHRVLVASLLTVVAVQVLRTVAWLGPASRLGAALVLGGLLGWAHGRWRPAQQWTRLAAPAPVIFAALFLFAGPVAGLLRTPSAAPVAVAATAADSVSPVVLIVFDEFPLRTLLNASGGIDERIFPNLAALAGESTFYRNATSVAARTAHAVPSILTGRFPQDDLAPTRAHYPENLFTLLQRSHRIHAFESVTSLCPEAACPRATDGGGRPWELLDAAARVWLWSVTPWKSATTSPLGVWFSEDLAREEARFGEFLASIDGEGTPFHFLHVILPHAPWQYLPGGLRYPPRDLGLVDYDERTEERWPALVDHQRHVMQAVYVDGLVGQAVARLKAAGLYERSTLLVTADHGISFEPGLVQGTRNLAAETAHEIAWVPFLLKTPGQESGVVSDANVMTIDVAPTLAELAGIPLPWRVDGVSLAAEPVRDQGKVWFNRPGAALDLDADQAYPKVLSGVVQALARPDEGVDGLFKIGPFADLIGTAPFEYAPDHQHGTVGRIEGLALYDHIDMDAGIVPALVAGYLDASAEASPPDGVAIVVNGTIAAVSELYSERDQPQRFAALVSPAWMLAGANTVELFVVDAAGDRRILRQVEVQPVGARGPGPGPTTAPGHSRALAP